MLPLSTRTTAYDSHPAVVFALTTSRPIINGIINKGIYFGRLVSMARSIRAVLLVLVAFSVVLLCMQRELCACMFAGNRFTPFHRPQTHMHFLHTPVSCWHKSTTLMRLFTKSRLYERSQWYCWRKDTPLNLIHPSPPSHLLISVLALLSVYLDADSRPLFLPLALSAGSPFNRRQERSKSPAAPIWPCLCIRWERCIMYDCIFLM